MIRIPEADRSRLNSSLGPDEADLLARVDSRLSPHDGMFRDNGLHYYGVGLSALRCIERSLDGAGKREVAAVLDLPCGFGRVLRFLAVRFPAARIHACDIQSEAVDFCARTFGATPAHSLADLDELVLDARFDLIWCGSLVTHLPESSTRKLLRLFSRHLGPGGLALFSTHGEAAVRRIAAADHGARSEDVAAAIEAFGAGSYAFLPHPRTPHYGISLTSAAVIRELLDPSDLEELRFDPAGWDHHHDVFTVARAARRPG